MWVYAALATSVVIDAALIALVLAPERRKAGRKRGELDEAGAARRKPPLDCNNYRS